MCTAFRDWSRHSIFKRPGVLAVDAALPNGARVMILRRLISTAREDQIPTIAPVPLPPVVRSDVSVMQTKPLQAALRALGLPFSKRQGAALPYKADLQGWLVAGQTAAAVAASRLRATT